MSKYKKLTPGMMAVIKVHGPLDLERGTYKTGSVNQIADVDVILRVGWNSAVWYKNGRVHRDGGPATETDITRRWYMNGNLHREDGPAVEQQDGSQIHRVWYLNGHPTGERTLEELPWPKE